MPSAPPHPWTTHLEAVLAGLDARHRRRVLKAVASAQGPRVVFDDRELVLCASNDYLGLAADPGLAEAAAAAARESGTGAGASRLISGSMAGHHELEAAIAEWKGTEAALVFNSGYHANVGTISALVGRGDVVYSDALNHASIIDGCRLSRATVRVYPHGDAAALDRLLAADAGAGGRRLIVTDTVFSMDADEAPLAALADVADAHGAWLMVDEAHAAGVLGPEGRGLVADLGLGERVPIQMGTFGKALGSFGAYVAGSRALVDVLLNRARSFVFTTALPPTVIAASRAALTRVRSDGALRDRALANAAALRARLAEQGWEVLPGRVPILPVVIGGDAETMALSRQLLGRGILAVGIRPPTVPEGTARIRVAVSAAHTAADMDAIAAAFGAREATLAGLDLG